MFLKLFNSVKITKGAKNSIIYDTDTGFLKFIPNVFFDLLSNEFQNYSILKKQLGSDSIETLEEYLKFITENNLGLLLSSKKELLSLSGKSTFYELPSKVDYIILDISISNILSTNLIQQIHNLKIKYLQIRFSEVLDVNDIIEVISQLELFNSSNINEISIVAKYSSELFSFIKETHYEISNKFLTFILHTAGLEDFQTFGYTNLTINHNSVKLRIN